MQIIVADADASAARHTITTLTAGGHTTCQVATAADAFRAILAREADALVLDPSLPDIDGIELCANLRALDYRGIIMVTSRNCDTHSKVRAISNGADGYIVKPAAPVELLARIDAIDRLIHCRSAR